VTPRRTKVYSAEYAFAALKTDGSIVAWGHSMYGGIGAPIDSGYTKIYSNALEPSALRAAKAYSVE
jgi:alpha-tubulin suppressor-like RCC1 family protein